MLVEKNLTQCMYIKKDFLHNSKSAWVTLTVQRWQTTVPFNWHQPLDTNLNKLNLSVHKTIYFCVNKKSAVIKKNKGTALLSVFGDVYFQLFLSQKYIKCDLRNHLTNNVVYVPP